MTGGSAEAVAGPLEAAERAGAECERLALRVVAEGIAGPLGLLVLWEEVEPALAEGMRALEALDQARAGAEEAVDAAATGLRLRMAELRRQQNRFGFLVEDEFVRQLGELTASAIETGRYADATSEEIAIARRYALGEPDERERNFEEWMLALVVGRLASRADHPDLALRLYTVRLLLRDLFAARGDELGAARIAALRQTFDRWTAPARSQALRVETPPPAPADRAQIRLAAPRGRRQARERRDQVLAAVARRTGSHPVFRARRTIQHRRYRRLGPLVPALVIAAALARLVWFAVGEPAPGRDTPLDRASLAAIDPTLADGWISRQPYGVTFVGRLSLPMRDLTAARVEALLDRILSALGSHGVVAAELVDVDDTPVARVGPPAGRKVWLAR